MELQDPVRIDPVAVRAADVLALTFALNELFDVRDVVDCKRDCICPILAL